MSSESDMTRKPSCDKAMKDPLRTVSRTSRRRISPPFDLTA